jgi:hypothetical protein
VAPPSSKQVAADGEHHDGEREQHPSPAEQEPHAATVARGPV